LILLVGAGWIWFSRIPSESGASQSLSVPQEGFLAPDFNLTTLSGDNFVLSQHRGYPVIINFWASWCPPCRAEMPAFQQAFAEYEEQGLMIAAVNATYQDSRSEATAFASENKLIFPIPLDTTGAVSRSYNLYSLPTTVFIDSQGIIRKIIIGGPIPTALLRVEVEKLIQEKP
jgi:thiol-disulfide isomerase/thioredoxin